jgi:hypothetical protein
LQALVEGARLATKELWGKGAKKKAKAAKKPAPKKSRAKAAKKRRAA